MARGLRAIFDILKVTDDSVFIKDEDGPVSITNDAEAVCKDLYKHFGDKRIFYIDSDGCKDELVHMAGVFQRFSPGWGGRDFK